MTDSGDDPTLVYETVLDGDGRPRVDERGFPVRVVVGVWEVARTGRTQQ